MTLFTTNYKENNISNFRNLEYLILMIMHCVCPAQIYFNQLETFHFAGKKFPNSGLCSGCIAAKRWRCFYLITLTLSLDRDFCDPVRRRTPFVGHLSD